MRQTTTRNRRRARARAINRRADPGQSLVTIIGAIVLLMLAWGGLIASGLGLH